MHCGDSTSLSILRSRLLEGKVVRLPDETISEIFLDNLKTATPWVIRRMNILLLTEHAKAGGGQVLHIAAHFSNLIKVSDRVTVRHSAGRALLELAPLLSVDQRNEIAVELCGAWSWDSRNSPSISRSIWDALPCGCRRSSWMSFWRAWLPPSPPQRGISWPQPWIPLQRSWRPTPCIGSAFRRTRGLAVAGPSGCWVC